MDGPEGDGVVSGAAGADCVVPAGVAPVAGIVGPAGGAAGTVTCVGSIRSRSESRSAAPRNVSVSDVKKNAPPSHIVDLDRTLAAPRPEIRLFPPPPMPSPPPSDRCISTSSTRAAQMMRWMMRTRSDIKGHQSKETEGRLAECLCRRHRVGHQVFNVTLQDERSE
jgi:hypothetical protein